MAPSKDINDPDVFILYRYHPSEVAAIIFVVLFGISTLVHAGQAWRKRSWFMIPFIIGGLFEMVGYIGRVLSSHDQWELGPYIMQSLLLLVAPALFAASIYMVLGRIILLTNGEKYALVRRTWLTKFFVGGDVLSFLAQSAGGGIMSMAKKNPDNMKLGEKIVIVGLFIQIAFFGFFVIVSILFQIRGHDHFHQLDSTVRWRKYLYMLYTVSILILVRSVFRVVEYLQGNAGYLLRHEVFLYVFDAMLMFKAMLIMNVIHPGEIAQHLKKQQKDTVSMEQLQDSDYSREGVDRV